MVKKDYLIPPHKNVYHRDRGEYKTEDSNFECMIEQRENSYIISACIEIDCTTEGGKNKLKTMFEQQTNALIPGIKEYNKREKKKKKNKPYPIYNLPNACLRALGVKMKYEVCRHFHDGKEILHTTHNFQEAEEKAIEMCKTHNVKITIYENDIPFKAYPPHTNTITYKGAY